MKKIFTILNVAIMALFALGCENQNGGGDGITFKFGEASVTSSAIEVSVTPSDSNINYFADIFATDDIQGKDDATIIDECLNSEKFRSRKGTQIVAAKNLTPETSYTVVAFALTETKVTRKVYTTTETVAPLSPEEFNINIEVKDITATSATAIATPNGSNRYYFRVITKMELDAFGIYNDDYQIFEYIIENPNSSEWITEGKTTLNYSLAAETDYLAVAFNFENWEAMHNKEDNMKLFRHEFKTPVGEQVDPDTLFITSNLITDHTNFNLDVTPANPDQQWTYYIWTKKSYDETLATEAKANIVMRSYFGLNNIAVEQGYDFGTIIQTDKLGKVGSNTINAYETLRPNTAYVVVLFYVDPTNSDPTEIYDYNYVAVEFTTAESTGTATKLEVSEPIIESTGFAGYSVKFNIKVDSSAVMLSKGANLWNENIESYWDPSDWNSIRAFFWLYPVDAETLTQAKTSTGCVIAFTSEGADDYVFFFEAENAEGTRSQVVVRVTPEMFTNAQ